MESIEQLNLFATKGAEYLLVILYLGAITVAWMFFNRKPARVAAVQAGMSSIGNQSWFSVPENKFFHPGHSWLSREGRNNVRVGIDDFAQKLIGETDKVILPEPGTHLDQGATGWFVEVDGKTVPQLSPVSGKVMKVNKNVVDSPDLLNSDPYGNAWLLEVAPDNIGRNIKNLLSGEFAMAWMEKTKNMLSESYSGGLGTVLQDGGTPVSGIAKAIAPDDWEKIVREYLLTS